jgi:Tfp pilus assembly protein PilF
MEPRNAEYRNNLGVTHMRKGNLDQAEKSFHKALKLEPTNRMSSHHLIVMLSYHIISSLYYGSSLLITRLCCLDDS